MIAMIVFILLIVGVPACSGAFMVARYFGSSRTSGGASLLVFSIAAAVGFYLFPNTRLDPYDYATELVLIFIIAVAAGALLGLVAKRRSES